MFKLLKEIFSGNSTPLPDEIDIGVLSSLWMPKAPVSSDAKRGQTTSTQQQSTSVRPEPATPPSGAYDALKDIIEPVKNLIETKGAWDGLMKVFEIVERYGSYPSVVLSDDGIEYRNEVLSILSNVSIKDHSVRVVRLMVDELRKHHRDISGLILIATLAGLMHDIGKAEPLRSSPQYSKHDHPLIGADILKSCFEEEFYDLNKAIEIIRGHHKVSNDSLTSIFLIADERARMDELKTASATVASIEDTLSAGDILHVIDPVVNVPKSEKEWGAFSFRDVVYLEPDCLYDLLMQLGSQKNTFFFGQIKAISRSLFLKSAVDILKAANMLAPIKLTHGYFGWFEVTFGNNSRKMMLIPISVTAFGKMPSDFESRKLAQSRSGSIKFITAVVPSKGR